MKKTTKTVVTKKVATKTTKKVAVKKTTPTLITMTVNQAKRLQKALGTKSYAFLNKKVNEVTND